MTFEISVSLDGYVAGPAADLEQPLGRGGERLHDWVVPLASWREQHGMEGGERGPDDDFVRAGLERKGATIMGRRMFSGGRGPWEDDPNAGGWWGEEPPFRHPVFVLTHHAREPLALGETTFTFVTDGIESALAQAREAARESDVAVAGGADVARQYLAAGQLDEITLHLRPIFLGGGVRLFDGFPLPPDELEPVSVAGSPAVTHLTYRPRGA